REAPKPGEQPREPKPAPRDATWSKQLAPDPVLLFRYSALTFNGHRIHYDHPYVTQEEGYPGLIVHGPLIATLLLDLLRRERPEARVTEFSFRAKRPLFSPDPFDVRGWPAADGRSVRLIAVNPEGSAAMVAEAQIAP
ncbi:MAG TPA: acyl-CoA dehydrogenase, partial [Stellaceae bacterium]|nr:acyl-CoA dehydrogenase [Stellaceae bacterium]